MSAPLASSGRQKSKRNWRQWVSPTRLRCVPPRQRAIPAAAGRPHDMRLRKQDSAGDMQFGHNAGDFWHDQIEGVGQSIVTRLMLWRGEWFLNRNDGTPWGGFPLNTDAVNRGQILGVHTQLTRDVALRQRVLAGPGVMGIVQY